MPDTFGVILKWCLDIGLDERRRTSQLLEVTVLWYGCWLIPSQKIHQIEGVKICCTKTCYWTGHHFFSSLCQVCVRLEQSGTCRFSCCGFHVASANGVAVLQKDFFIAMATIECQQSGAPGAWHCCSQHLPSPPFFLPFSAARAPPPPPPPRGEEPLPGAPSVLCR